MHYYIYIFISQIKYKHDDMIYFIAYNAYIRHNI